MILRYSNQIGVLLDSWNMLVYSRVNTKFINIFSDKQRKHFERINCQRKEELRLCFNEVD